MTLGSIENETLLRRAKRWARSIKRDVVALWIAARDPRVPWYAKAICAAVAAYALSPIDLIPDFIPVIGYLDDLILVPLGILLAVRLVPADLMAEFRAEADARAERPVSRMAASVIVALWIGCAALALWASWPRALVG
ncbi:MAG: hypothetical protein BGN87_00015 [Rhizobiales bacterium 65-79]|nr:DUF1232 domain-containing protein [Hyphomicrobiales bacterium]OJU02573.1 MAG: hypothetical protein BGN87_00015 [Rhizobiales bacterium 65-79]